MHHTKHQVKYLMPNLFPKVKKYRRPMRSPNRCHREHPGRIWAHIREMKERLARLASLFEDHIKIEAVHPRGPSPLPNQHVPQPFVQMTSHLPCETHCPNLWQPIPTAPPAFIATSRPVDQPSGSGANLADKRLTRTKPNGTPSPSLTPSYSQN